MDDVQSPEQPIKKLSQEQKAGFTLLLIFAVIAVGLGFLQIRNTMYGPFRLGSGVPAEVSNDVNGVETLAYRDTDNDGLSDFDELYVYGTSPYLADTDSDGMPDGAEVQGGSNPACPQGKSCGNNIAASTDASGVASGTFSYSQLSGFATDYDFTQDFKSAQMNFLAQMLNDPSALRQLLVRQGMSAEQVNAISNDDLKKLTQQALAELNNPAYGASSTAALFSGVASDSSAPSGGTLSGGIQLPAELLKQLSDPAQARALLVKQGFDKSTLDKMSDEQIIALVQETLNALAAGAN